MLVIGIEKDSSRGDQNRATWRPAALRAETTAASTDFRMSSVTSVKLRPLSVKLRPLSQRSYVPPNIRNSAASDEFSTCVLIASL
jgi:hypothetical protein